MGVRARASCVMILMGMRGGVLLRMYSHMCVRRRALLCADCHECGGRALLCQDSHVEILQLEIVNVEILHTEIVHVEILHVEILQVEVVHVEILHVQILHVEFLHVKVLHVEIFHVEILHVEILAVGELRHSTPPLADPSRARSQASAVVACA